MAENNVDLEQERSLLGAILVTDCLTAVLAETHLRPENFQLPRNRKLWEAAVRLESREEPVDCITLAAESGDTHDYLNDLAAEVAVPGNALNYAKLVLDASHWTSRGATVKELGAAAERRDEDDWSTAEAALADSVREDRSEYDSERLGDMLYEQAEGKEQVSFRWPFDGLNQARTLMPGNLVVLSGHTAMGKSLLVDQLLDRNHADGHSAHLYINEMSILERATRRMVRYTGLPPRKLEAGNLDAAEKEVLLARLNVGMGWGMSDVAGWSAAEICRDIRRRRAQICVVDMLHGVAYSDESELSQMMTMFSATAKISGSCLVLVSDLNEKRSGLSTSARRPSPTLGDLKGSGSISRRADLVCFIHRQQSDDGFQENEGRVFLAKSRSGSQASVPVVFNASRLRFDD